MGLLAAGTDRSPAHTRPAVFDSLVGIAEVAGLDITDAELIKYYNNATFVLPRERVIVRVAGSAALAEKVHQVVRSARWLEEIGFPAVRLNDGVPNPVVCPDAVASLWNCVDPVRPATPDDLAALLRALHATTPTPELPTWTPVEDVYRRVVDASGLTEPERSFLLRTCDELDRAVDRLTDDLDYGLIHGDACLDNVIVGRGGPVLCDLDRMCRGPVQWDLVPTFTAAYHFESGVRDQEHFAKAYGVDITTWHGAATFHRLRELKLVTSVVSLLDTNPAVRAEFAHRLRTFQAGETRARWHRFADMRMQTERGRS